jgi:hypothetical protein
MSAVYSGKSGTGPSTGTSATLIQVSPSSTGYYTTSRIFTPFQTASGTYTADTLNVNFSCTPGTHGGICTFYYSTNGGSSWTLLYSTSASTSQATQSLAIGAVSLANVKFLVCIDAVYAAGGGTTSTTVYDIWSTGTLNNGKKVYSFFMQ